MTTIDLRPQEFNIHEIAGADLSIVITCFESDGTTPVDVSAYTFAADVLRAGEVVESFADAVTGGDNNILTLTLTDAETGAIGTGRGLEWALKVTASGSVDWWYAGEFRLYAPGTPRTAVTSTEATAVVGAAITANLTIGVPAVDTAANVSIADAGTYFTGTDVEAALQELGSLKAPKASPALTGTPTAPTAATATSTTQIATTAFVQANRTAQAALDAAQYAPSVVDDDTFATATATAPPSSESTKAYVDASVALRAPQVNTKFITPNRFVLQLGAPVREVVNGNDGWSFRTGQNDGVVATLHYGDDIPAHWVTFSVKVVWANQSATTGQVRFQTRTGSASSWSVGDTLPTVSSPNTSVNDTAAGTQFLVEDTTLATFTAQAEDYLSLPIRRNGGGETGGVANSISFLGVLLTKVT